MFDWLNRNKKEASISEIARPIIDRLIESYLEEVKGTDAWTIKPGQINAGREILGLESTEQVAILHSLLACYIAELKRLQNGLGGWTYNSSDMTRPQSLQAIISQMFRRNLPFRESDLEAYLRISNRAWKVLGWYKPHKVILGAVERSYRGQDIPKSIVHQIKKIRSLTQSIFHTYAEDRELNDRARSLLGDIDKLTLNADFNWSKSLLQDIALAEGEQKKQWEELIAHALTASASKPSNKWISTANELLANLGYDPFIDNFHRLTNNILAEKFTDNPLENSQNSTALKGLIWIASLLPQESTARDVKLLANYCFRKIPNIGAVSVKAGNACLYVLGQLPGMQGIAMLSELMQKIKYPSARKIIEKELDAAANRRGMSRNDLEELSVPNFGLNTLGQLIVTFAEFEATVSIAKEKTVNLVWKNTKLSKTQKSIPSSLKKTYANEIKELKQTTKDIQATLQSQASRIENLYLKKVDWGFTDWQSRYINHTLLQYFGHKLIWQLIQVEQSQSAIWFKGQLVDSQGNHVSISAEESKVRLWHPIDSKSEEVLAWRQFLQNHEITQPFKQAHREVYLLTEAEQQTEQYSNRFAAHILKQHQMSALCQQRGWRYFLQGGFDSHNTPSLDLPEWDMRAEFWVDGIEASINDAGIFNYVSSDQVRFINDNEVILLPDLDPLVFSEVMRNIDLFIGVCSIGNDPAWQDGGLERYNAYWENYSFGELDISAETRKEVLNFLLPKLKIARQCEIKDRFLVVKGSLRTYKIHLGSANILMEPNNQYLCIVENLSKKANAINELFLPFEGDHRMSVIISKAFLLADDEKITDKTILSQISR